VKKLFKFVMWLVIATVVIVGAAIVAVPMLVDPNDYRDQIANMVKDQTGRELTIKGELKMTVFPWLGVDIGPTQLSNADGFSDAVFAASERIQVRVKVAPLLSRRIEMDTVTVHGLTLNLERNAKGLGNWEDLSGGDKSDKSAKSALSANGGERPAIAALVLGGLELEGAKLKWTDKAAGQAITLSNVGLKTGAATPGQPVDVKVGLDVALSNPAATGRVELGATVAVVGDIISASGLTVTANMAGASLAGGKLTAKLAAALQLDNAKHQASLQNLSLSVADLQLDGGVNITGLDKAPVVSGKLSVAKFDLRKLLQALGQAVPNTADANVLSAVALNADLSGGANSVKLSPLTVSLDDSKLTGSLSVANFAKPAIKFDLALDKIDADRYLPPATQAKAATPGAAAAGASMLPLEQLRALNVDGKFELGQLKLSGLSMSNIGATVKAQGGTIKAAPLRAQLYGGSYAGNVGIDARGKVAKLSLNETIKGVNIAPLLKDLQGETSPLEGTAEVRLKATTSGNNPDAMKRALNGSGKFSFANGAINGLNIAAMIRDAKAKILGGSATAANAPKRTDFSVLGGTFVIKNGLVDNRDFAGKTPLLRIKGKGTADLVKEVLNYRTTTSIVATAKGQGGKDLKELAGLDIPLLITGSFAKPEYALDQEALVKLFATGKAKELLGAGTEGVKKAVTGKLKDAVGGGAVGALTKQLGGAAGSTAPASKDPAAAAGKALKSLFGN